MEAANNKGENSMSERRKQSEKPLAPTHKVENVLRNLEPGLSEDDLAYARLYQRQVETWRNIDKMKAELEELENSIEKRADRIHSLPSSVDCRKVQDLLSAVHGEGWNK